MFFGGLNGDDFDPYGGPNEDYSYGEDGPFYSTYVYVKKDIYCKYCNTGPLSWIKIDEKWKLKDKNGKIHSCHHKLTTIKKKTNSSPQAKRILKDVLEDITLSNSDLDLFYKIMDAIGDMTVEEVLRKLRN